MIISQENRNISKVKQMEILNVTLEKFRNKVIGKTILFTDDTSVSIDIKTNQVYDMDGMWSVSRTKK